MPSLPQGFGSPLVLSPWPISRGPFYSPMQQQQAYVVCAPAWLSANCCAVFKIAQRPAEQPLRQISATGECRADPSSRSFQAEVCRPPTTCPVRTRPKIRISYAPSVAPGAGGGAWRPVSSGRCAISQSLWASRSAMLAGSCGWPIWRRRC